MFSMGNGQLSSLSVSSLEAQCAQWYYITYI